MPLFQEILNYQERLGRELLPRNPIANRGLIFAQQPRHLSGAAQGCDHISGCLEIAHASLYFTYRGLSRGISRVEQASA